jgi:hypothetical protein
MPQSSFRGFVPVRVSILPASVRRSSALAALPPRFRDPFSCSDRAPSAAFGVDFRASLWMLQMGTPAWQIKGHREDLWERAQLFDDRAGRGHRGQYARSDQERSELRLDVQTVMTALPPELRAIWRLLAELGQEKAAATLGVSLTAMQEHISEIRRRCEKAGLRRYL